MKRATVWAFTLSVLTVSVLGVSCFADSVEAFTLPKDTTPPTIEIISPVNNQTTNRNQVLLNFTLTKPPAWHTYVVCASIGITGLEYGVVNSFSYTLDGNASETFYNFTDLQEPFKYCTKLPNLADGRHTLKIDLDAVSYWSGKNWSIIPRQLREETPITATSNTIIFYVDTTPPVVSALSLKNKTFNISEVPLEFCVNENTQLSYSINNQANTTFAGNTTLTGLIDGTHSIVIYAYDVAGNTGASETAYFTIDTTNPRPSSTQQTSPPQTETETFPTEMAYVAALTGIAVITTTTAIILKRKKEKTSRTKEEQRNCNSDCC